VSTYLLDTNVISLLVRKMPQVDARFRNELRSGSEFLLSALVDYES